MHRLISTIRAIPGADGRPPRLGISEGGWHAAEALVLARYFMFTQVYFHKTRVAFDIHVRLAMKELLPSGIFPRPTKAELDDYLLWDDWRVLGCLSRGEGGEHGQRLAGRRQYKRIYATPEVCSEDDLEKLSIVKNELGGLVAAEAHAGKSWYKTGKTDIPVVSENRDRRIAPLSKYSSTIAGIRANNQTLLYSKPELAEEARKAKERALKQ